MFNNIPSLTNRMALQVGARNGLDVVGAGVLAGAGLGGIGGAFSENDTMLSGAIKGGMIGAPLGMGVKYIGSRYSRGFIEKNPGIFNDVITNKTQHNWNTDYFSTGKFTGTQSFMDRMI